LFEAKPYFEVNREERFFCFLLAHALLSSNSLKEKFANLIKSKFNFQLNPKNFEVYVEAAALRDYWRSLGDPKIYNSVIEQKRHDIIEMILNYYKLPITLIDESDFFWTAGPKRKLWSPGHWNEAAIKETELEELKKESLIHVKWAFNAKPDIMIISGSSVLMIEAKVESRERRKDKTKYQQQQIQKLISELLKLLVPQFHNSIFSNKMLKLKKSERNFSWQEIISLAIPSEMDEFTIKSFSAFKERYYKKDLITKNATKSNFI